MTETPPPHSPASESALIGSVMINPDIFQTLTVIPNDFYILRNRWIWEAMVTLSNDQQPLDYITICSELKRSGWLEELGGPAYITRMMNECPTSENAQAYAKQVALSQGISRVHLDMRVWTEERERNVEQPTAAYG